MSTREEALARALAAFESLVSQKSGLPKKQSDETVDGLWPATKKYLAKEAGMVIVHTETNKLGAILPVGMTANKMAKIVEANKQAIEEFKTSNKENLKL